MESGIYKILNNINGKFYIGSTKNFNKRWVSHKYLLRLNKHENKHLQYAWNKYGEEHFQFIKFQDVKIENLIIWEQHYINTLDVYNRNIGYNLSPTANSTLGFKFSEESKMKMSLAKKGKQSSRKNYKHSEETKKKIGENNKISQLGRIHSEGTKIKMSKWHTNKIVSDETKKKISKYRTGKLLCEETKIKISQKMMGNKYALGHKHTEETKKKISEILKGHNDNNKPRNIGESNGMSKTNELEVLSIRDDYNNKNLSIKELMVKYNKNYQFIYKIIKRLRWNWL